MQIVILDDAAQVAAYGANIFAKQLLKPASVLGLATGSTPVALYQERLLKIKLARFRLAVITFNLDEYLGLTGEHPQSYRYFMNEQLFNHVDIDKQNTHVPPGDAVNPLVACTEYEQKSQQLVVLTYSYLVLAVMVISALTNLLQV